MSRARGDLEVRFLERVPTGREETALGASGTALITAFALIVGCSAAAAPRGQAIITSLRSHPMRVRSKKRALFL